MDMESSWLDEDEDAVNGEEEVAEQLLNMSHGFFENEIEVAETVAVEEEPSQVPCPWCSRLFTNFGMTRHQIKCKKRPMQVSFSYFIYFTLFDFNYLSFTLIVLHLLVRFDLILC
jgi:hypothetical protein